MVDQAPNQHAQHATGSIDLTGIRAGSVQVYTVDHRVVEMTRETAGALVDMKKLEHAVPARNETYRHALTVGAVLVPVVWLLWLLTQAVRDKNDIAGSLLWAIVAILAVLGAEPIVKALIKRAKSVGVT